MGLGVRFRFEGRGGGGGRGEGVLPPEEMVGDGDLWYCLLARCLFPLVDESLPEEMVGEGVEGAKNCLALCNSPPVEEDVEVLVGGPPLPWEGVLAGGPEVAAVEVVVVPVEGTPPTEALRPWVPRFLPPPPPPAWSGGPPMLMVAFLWKPPVDLSSICDSHCTVSGSVFPPRSFFASP